MGDRVFVKRPAALTREAQLCMDAVEILVSSVDLTHRRLVSSANEQGRFDPGTDESLAVGHALVTDVINLVTSLRRLARVVDRLPGDPVGRPLRRKFAKSMAPITEARNHFEHLDQSLRTVADTGHGVFGGISWWKAEGDEWVGTIFVPGQLAVAEGVGELQVPSRPPTGIGAFRTVLAGESFDLTAAVEAVAALVEGLRHWSEQLGDAAEAGSGDLT